MVRKTGLLLLSVLAILLVATMNSLAQDTMTRHTRDVTQTGAVQPVGRLAANRIMQLDLVLPLRDPQGLDLLLQQLYDPNSVHYRQFLTVPEFTERFGPTQVDYDAVVSFAQSEWPCGGGRHARRHGCAGARVGVGGGDGLPCAHGDVSASHREPDVLRAGP